MKLVYRGIPYQSGCNIAEVNQSGMDVQYRGAAARIGVSQPSALQPAKLKYRGISYMNH